MIVLDSSALIHILRGTEKGKEIKKMLETETYATTAFSVHEILVGYKERETIMSFFKSIAILPFNVEASLKSVEIEDALKKKGKLMAKIDLFIASICIVHNLSFVTTDNDFKNIAELKLTII